MEAVDITPDGKFLVSMLQSATRQDNPGNKDFNRAYTRLFLYDITKNATPTNPTDTVSCRQAMDLKHTRT